MSNMSKNKGYTMSSYQPAAGPISSNMVQGNPIYSVTMHQQQQMISHHPSQPQQLLQQKQQPHMIPMMGHKTEDMMQGYYATSDMFYPTKLEDPQSLSSFSQNMYSSSSSSAAMGVIPPSHHLAPMPEHFIPHDMLMRNPYMQPPQPQQMIHPSTIYQSSPFIFAQQQQQQQPIQYQQPPSIGMHHIPSPGASVPYAMHMNPAPSTASNINNNAYPSSSSVSSELATKKKEKGGVSNPAITELEGISVGLEPSRQMPKGAIPSPSNNGLNLSSKTNGKTKHMMMTSDEVRSGSSRMEKDISRNFNSNSNNSNNRNNGSKSSNNSARWMEEDEEIINERKRITEKYTDENENGFAGRGHQLAPISSTGFMDSSIFPEIEELPPITNSSATGRLSSFNEIEELEITGIEKALPQRSSFSSVSSSSSSSPPLSPLQSQPKKMKRRSRTKSKIQTTPTDTKGNNSNVNNGNEQKSSSLPLSSSATATISGSSAKKVDVSNDENTNTPPSKTKRKRRAIYSKITDDDDDDDSGDGITTEDDSEDDNYSEKDISDKEAFAETFSTESEEENRGNEAEEQEQDDNDNQEKGKTKDKNGLIDDDGPLTMPKVVKKRKFRRPKFDKDQPIPMEPLKRRRGKSALRSRQISGKTIPLDKIELETLLCMEDELIRILNDEVKIMIRDKANTFNLRESLPSVKRKFIKRDKEGNDYMMQKTLPHRHKDPTHSCIACSCRSLFLRINNTVKSKTPNNSELHTRAKIAPIFVDIDPLNPPVLEPKVAKPLFPGDGPQKHIFKTSHPEELLLKARGILVDYLGFTSAIKLFDPITKDDIPSVFKKSLHLKN